MSIVRRYLDFKVSSSFSRENRKTPECGPGCVCVAVPQVGEVWQEINRELGLDGVRPISPDAEALISICSISGDAAVSVAHEQSSILEQQKKEEFGKEEHMYKEVLAV